CYFFFFQAEDGIRDRTVTGVQTCALPIYRFMTRSWEPPAPPDPFPVKLIDLTIPAAVPVLSFKVMEDGRLKLLLQPGGGAPLVRSEERRVGKECRSMGEDYDLKRRVVEW